MEGPSRVEKFAEEPVAYFLHKRRDFLQRLHSKKEEFEQKAIIGYQNTLKFIAGESPEGRRRVERLQRRREDSLA
jgi:hypothetical protein